MSNKIMNSKLRRRNLSRLTLLPEDPSNCFIVYLLQREFNMNKTKNIMLMTKQGQLIEYLKILQDLQKPSSKGNSKWRGRSRLRKLISRRFSTVMKLMINLPLSKINSSSREIFLRDSKLKSESKDNSVNQIIDFLGG
jgi:hypothetical protein